MKIRKKSMRRKREKELLKSAKRWLKRAKGKGRDVRICIDYVKQDLRMACAEPENIGTSDKELKELLQNYFLNSAKGCLERIRRKKGRFIGQYVSYMRTWLEEGRLELEDIGTNEEEISKILQEASS